MTSTSMSLRTGASAERDTSLRAGEFSLRKLRIPEDIPLLHDWVRRSYATFWGLGGRSPAEVEATYRQIVRQADVYFGLRGETAVFLLELYEPKNDEIGTHYAVQPGDRGMHLLLAPPERPERGFSWLVFRSVMEFLFSEPAVERVVVEPDIRNAKIHALNLRAGFRYQRVVQLASKTAHLAFCTRDDFERACSHASLASSAPNTLAARHLEPEAWTAANRELVRKFISELSHERVLAPVELEPGAVGAGFVLRVDAVQQTEYRFGARVLALNHWLVDADSIERVVAGARQPLDALAFVREFREQLALSDTVLPVYLEEIASTLYAGAFKRVEQRFSAADLVHASYQEIEASMTEGHPAFIANSGRIGFDARDYRAFAPESAQPITIGWLAAHRARAEVTLARDLEYELLLEGELGRPLLARFREQLRARGLEPEAYLFIPVHPWQWQNKLCFLFAPDLAVRDLVWLGESEDQYQAQQSIRTLFNLSAPHKHYVKCALSVLNMGFMRGLSADYMRDTPAICDWVAELVHGDPYLRARSFRILREVAGFGYRSAHYDAALPKGSPYRKLLAALYRESPLPQLTGDQRLMTMAALLHRDRDGDALLPQLICASGLSVDAWLARYLDVYLTPLLHCFFAHDLAFMPHGENLVLVLEAHVPVGVFMKDIAEEVARFEDSELLPERVRRIVVSVPEEVRPLSIFTDVFDGIFRFLAPVLLEQADYPEARFWQQVADCIARYQDERPELRDKFARFDLFAPTFLNSCLNRLQLRNNQQMVDLTNPAEALQFAGTLENPIARGTAR